MNAITPIFEKNIERVRELRGSDELKKEAAKAERVNRVGALAPVDTSPIERFNATCRIEDLLVKYGYEEGARIGEWRSPHQQSGSYATHVSDREDGSEYFVTFSESDASAGVGKPSQTGLVHWGDAFDLYAHYEHKNSFKAALEAWKAKHAQFEAERRQAQRAENALIGSEQDTVPLAEIMTVAEMEERFVFICDGSQVADVNCPQSALKLADFNNAMAGSVEQVPNAAGGTKSVKANKVWLESPNRKQADVLTFHAGAGIMTRCPNGRQALNIWRPKGRPQAPDDWAVRAKPFIEHINWLFGPDARPFLDWLAHIEQKPGVLPHFGWLHISRLHGAGRNWIASVLTRLWRGNVAASLDLTGLLEGSFNDRLSQCLLAIVDEVNEGGGQKYKTANRLRQLVTPEVREINPKFGRKRVEYNAARWLTFSNHTGALPLDEHDRRFWVVKHEGELKDAYYYKRLYGLLNEPEFIVSVAEYLQQRDISEFNPGQRPPMNQAKAALVEFGQSEEDARCKALVERWPVDLITSTELEGKLPAFSSLTKTTTRYAMDRSGITKLKKVRHGEKPVMVYSLRNHEVWSSRGPDCIRGELDKVTKGEKLAAMNDDDDEV